jgi:hypothetical protein
MTNVRLRKFAHPHLSKEASMVNLIAIHSIRRREPVKKSGPGQKDKFNTITISSGETFVESDEEEARRLIGIGAAKQAPLPLPAIGAGTAPAPGPLEKLTDAELVNLAKDRKIQIKDGATREEIITALNKAA